MSIREKRERARITTRNRGTGSSTTTVVTAPLPPIQILPPLPSEQSSSQFQITTPFSFAQNDATSTPFTFVPPPPSFGFGGGQQQSPFSSFSSSSTSSRKSKPPPKPIAPVIFTPPTSFFPTVTTQNQERIDSLKQRIEQKRQQQQQEAMEQKRQQQAAMEQQRQREFFEREQRQREFFAREKQKQDFERQRQQKQEFERQRQLEINQYLEYQRKMGVPDELYVILGTEEIKVYRNPNIPNQFWIEKNNETRGIGKLVQTGPNSFGLQWIRGDDFNPQRTEIMKRQETFNVTPRPTPLIPPPSLQKQKPTILSLPYPSSNVFIAEDVMELNGDEEFELESISIPFMEPEKPKRKEKQKPKKQEPKKQKSQEEVTFDIAPDVSTLSQANKELRKQEKRLVKKLTTPEAILESNQEQVRRDEMVERLKLEYLQERRQATQANLQTEAEKSLAKEVGKFKSKRARELEEEMKSELQLLKEMEEEQKTKLLKIRRDIKALDPEKQLKKAKKELDKVRELRLLSDIKKEQLETINSIKLLLNKRLFSENTMRDRTLAELLAQLPREKFGRNQSLQEFALAWDIPTVKGRPIRPQEDLISPQNQKLLLANYLCGYDPNKKGAERVLGYFEEVVGLDKDECNLKPE